MSQGGTRAGGRTLLLAVAALAALLAAAGRAQPTATGDPRCPAAGGATLTIEGFGLVEYRDVRTDRAADRVDFYGGVCFEAADGSWRAVADRLLVTDATSGTPGLRIERALLRIAGTRVRSRAVVSQRDLLLLDGVAVVGVDLVGTASSGSYDTRSGVLELVDPDLRTPSVALRGRLARLEGDTIVLVDGSVTTCVCDGEPAYRIETDRVDFVLGERTVRLTGATILTRSGGSLALGDVTLDEGAVAALRVPLVLATPAEGAGRLADTLTLLLDRLPLAPGLTLEAGIDGLDAGPVGGVARLSYRQPGEVRRRDGLRVAATVAFPYDGVVVESRLERALTPWLEVGFGIRQRHTARDDYLHDAGLTLRFAEGWTPLPGLELAASAEPFAAVSVQTFGGASPLGPRLGASASLHADAELGWAGDAALALDAAATHYPAADDPQRDQLWLRLRPDYRFSLGPVELEASYDRRLVWGESPFSARLDRVGELHRLSGEARLAGPLGGGVTGAIGGEVRYLLPPEREPARADRLRATASLRAPVRGGAVTVAAAGRFEGVLDDDDALDAWLEGRVGYADSEELATASVRLRWDLREGAVSDLVVAGGYPLRRGELTVTPYLALELAELLGGGGLALDGHGLLLSWSSCCGDLDLGYRTRDSDTSVIVAFAFPTRPIDPAEGAFDAIPAAPPPAGGATGAPGPAAPAGDGGAP